MGQAGNAWAPSVVFDQHTDSFVMYYSATEASTGDQCIVASAPATHRSAPTPDSSSAPMSARTGSTGAPPSTTGTTAEASTPTSLPTPSGAVVAHLEGRRRPHRPGSDLHLVGSPHGLAAARYGVHARSAHVRRRAVAGRESSRVPTCTSGRPRVGARAPITCSTAGETPDVLLCGGLGDLRHADGNLSRGLRLESPPHLVGRDVRTRRCGRLHVALRPAGHGLRRLAGVDDRLRLVRHPAHVSRRPLLRDWDAGRPVPHTRRRRWHGGGNEPVLPAPTAPTAPSRPSGTGRSRPTEVSSRSARLRSTVRPDPSS